MGSLANSNDPDEMQLNTAFHQGVHCLLRLIYLQGQKYTLIYTLLPVAHKNSKWKKVIIIVSICLRKFLQNTKG